MANQPDVDFKIGLATDDIKRAAVRVVRIKGGPAVGQEVPDRGTNAPLQVSRKVAHQFRDVGKNRATLNVLDSVTANPWQFEVEVQADFVFRRETSQWMLDGDDALDLLIHLCLLESCQVISYLTSRLGLRPLILPPTRPRE